jgi:phosphate transport system substrate-binding protein
VFILFFITELGFAGDLIYEGSSTIGEGVMGDAVKIFTAKTGIKCVKVGMQGSGKGFKAVLDGKADVGGLSKALSADEKKKVYFAIIGYDAVAIFVNKKNPVKNLSKDQVKGIFTGKITNWKEVGGNDAKIVVVTEVKAGDRATIAEFKKMALDNAEYCQSKEIDKPHDCVKYVAADENAITHASLAFSAPGAKVIGFNKVRPSEKNVRGGVYGLSRPLVIVAKREPQGNLRKFFDFILSPEGQTIIKKNFVTVK